MSDLIRGKLLKFVPDKVSGFEIKRINAVSGIYVTDKNGYIGIKINDYFSQNGSPYPGNYALVAKGPDYSSMGLGRVTFIEDTMGSVTIGDKTYRTVVMPDGKEWMAENLDFLPTEGITFRDGTSGNTWTNSTSLAQAAYVNYDETTYGWTGKKYGLLYNPYATRVLTIAGWHLPSQNELWDLASACGGYSSAGTKLKSTTEWTSGNGTDNYGFTVYPVGSFDSSGASGIGSRAVMTGTGSLQAGASFSTDASMNVSNYLSSTDGRFVRLVKDSE